jgi:hypothetical protein
MARHSSPILPARDSRTTLRILAAARFVACDLFEERKNMPKFLLIVSSLAAALA